jgi:hypothetical protein
MPFRLELELVGKGSRTLWTKTISAFHTISDNFKIDIRQGTDTGYDDNGNKCYSEVVFTSMNKTKTTVLDISFKKCFFKKFNIDGEINDIDYNNSNNQIGQYNYARSYSLIVNSRDMNILFKECAEDTVSWRIFMLSGDEISQMVYSNKLFVEFETKTGMKKKYSIVFRPTSMNFDSKIYFIYLKTLKHQQKIDDHKTLENIFGANKDAEDENDFDMMLDDDDDERVNRIALETVILRNFIQLFPSMLEDFRIEINPTDGLISFKGFNRQQHITKGEAAYNKPMTLGIQLRLNQIVYNNIRDQDKTEIDDNKSKNIQVSFRLKNFKTFLQIISFNLVGFNDDDNHNSSKKSKTIANHEDRFSMSDRENVCDIMFSKPGYPIIFERKYFIDGDNELLECCAVTLTEVTDGESDKIILEGVITNSCTDKLSNISMPTMNDNLRNRLASVDVREHGSNKSNYESISTHEPLFVVDDDLDDYSNKKHKNVDILESTKNDEEIDNLFWNNSKFHQSKVVEKPNKRELITNDNDCNDDDEDVEQVNNENNNDEYLGPTQKIQIKGIFD